MESNNSEVQISIISINYPCCKFVTAANTIPKRILKLSQYLSVQYIVTYARATFHQNRTTFGNFHLSSFQHELQNAVLASSTKAVSPIRIQNNLTSVASSHGRSVSLPPLPLSRPAASLSSRQNYCLSLPLAQGERNDLMPFMFNLTSYYINDTNEP